MAERETFSKEDLDKAIADAIAKNNAERDESEKGLKAKLDEVLSEKKAAADKAKEAEQAAAEEAARKKGDIEALEASWQKKMTDALAEKDAEIGTLRGSVDGLTIGRAASAMASEIAVQGSASVLERIIKDRLSVEMSENKPLVRVLDAAGKPSALSLDDLKAELSADKALAPIIAGSKGSGGGAANQSGGAAPDGKFSGLGSKVPGFSDLPVS